MMLAKPVEWFYQRNPLPWAFIGSRSGSLFRWCVENRDDTDGIVAVAVCQATADFVTKFGPIDENDTDHYVNYVNQAIYFALIGELKKKPPTVNVEFLESGFETDELAAQDELKPALDLLTKEEREVVAMLFGIDCKQKSIKEVSKLLLKQPERIRSIRAAAFCKMRALLRNNR